MTPALVEHSRVASTLDITITNIEVPVSRIGDFKMADVKIEKQDYEKDYVVRDGRHVILRVNKTLKVVLVQRDRSVA